MTNEEFVLAHRNDDVRKLAFAKVPDGVDVRWCLQQIEGWQLARKKLPEWAARDGVWFPPRISMEQCSSEQTAVYKRSVIEALLPDAAERNNLADLTGGFGIDFSYMAVAFRHGVYVERQSHLCEIARHNLSALLDDTTFEVCHEDSAEAITGAAETGTFCSRSFDVVFLDPARRDDIGRKVVALEDCTPNVIDLLPWLRSHTRYFVVKLSPMLDITQSLRQLKCVSQVHVVSVGGECKELLLVCRSEADVEMSLVSFHCVNLASGDSPFICDNKTEAVASIIEADELQNGDWQYLLEPNASLLKAGVQDALCRHFDVRKLHPMSNLFVSKEPVFSFPGRLFAVEAVGDFTKQSLRELVGKVQKANLTVRNFPATVAELRKRLKLKEGGDTYYFATTLSNGKHALFRCHKHN